MVTTEQICCTALVIVAMAMQAPGVSARLAKPGATHPSFPLDAFARPAYKLVFKNDDPVDNRTALEILRASRIDQDTGSKDSLAAYGRDDGSQETNGQRDGPPFRAYLHRSAPDSLHVCTIAQPRAPPEVLELDEKGLQEYRAGVLKRALTLLAPLKNMCLFHTFSWFTYSFCYGDAIKQFHALPSTLGGGKTPAMDPAEPSYVLGRWRDGIETIRNGDQTTSFATVGDGEESAAAGRRIDASDTEQGTELMELVHFSSLEDASDAGRMRSRLSESGSSDDTTVEGQGRYISQLWTDGTLCNINNEPRTTEVQFHCAKSPAVDRISVIKELTTCHYVVVVETPRLCSEPALAQAQDEVREVHCRPIVSDEELKERYLRNVQESQASLSAGAAEAAAVSRDAAGGDGTDSLAARESEHSKGGTDADDLSSSQITAEPLEAQLAKIFSELASTRLGNKDNRAAIEDVQVVVGMDEDGNLILEPRLDSDDTVAEGDDGQGDDQKHQGYGEKVKGLRGESRKIASGLTSERWAEVIRRIRELHGTNFIGADGTAFEVAQEQRNGRSEGPSDRQEGSVRGEKQGENEARPAGGREAGEAVHQMHSQQPRRAHGQPQRGNMMVREPESFAQRVERLYKAQEDDERRAKEAQAKQVGGHAIGAAHDEL